MSDSPDSVCVERVIAAPAEKIFDLLADPDRHSDIDGSGTVREAKSSSSTRLAMGSEFGMSMHLGIKYSTTNQVIEFDDGKRIAWQTGPSGVQGKLFGGRIWRYELEPAAGGGTTVRETWDISQEKGPVKYLLRMGKSKDHTRQSMEKTLAKIAELTEA